MRPQWLGLVLLLVACSSKRNDTPSPPPVNEACADRPGILPRPPGRGLPCELLPPPKQR